MTDTEQGLQQLYRARRTPALVDVPALGFLMIDGHGDPNGSQRYQAAIQALYAVSYALKFTVKRAGGPNHRIAPLEGPWWVEDMTRFTMQDKSAWDRTMMIRQPTEVTPQLAEQTARQAAENKQLPAARKLRLARYAEGRAAQVLHLGPYRDEGPTIGRLHAFIDEQGYAKRGKHHEIYLSDPRHTASERLKTIIRQPVSAR